MQLALFSDLNLRVVALTAMRKPGCKYTAVEVTEPLSVFRTHVSKVVSRPMELGLLDAVKGRNDGIYLRDSVTDKSIDKLLRTLENNEIVDCIDTNYPSLPMCLLHGKLAATQETFFAALDPALIVGLILVKPVGGTDGDTPERDSMPKGSMLNTRPVQVQS